MSPTRPGEVEALVVSGKRYKLSPVKAVGLGAVLSGAAVQAGDVVITDNCAYRVESVTSAEAREG